MKSFFRSLLAIYTAILWFFHPLPIIKDIDLTMIKYIMEYSKIQSCFNLEPHLSLIYIRTITLIFYYWIF